MNIQDSRQPVRPPRMTRSTSKESSTGLLMSVIKSLTASRDTVERDREKANLQREFQESDSRLDKLVLQHHVDLTSVMQAFSKISTRLHSSKDRVQGVREKLVACQKLLHCKRDELKRLWLESVENKNVLKLLDEVESLTKVPIDVRNFVAKKHYMHGTKLLVQSLESLDGHLKSIDALGEVKCELLAKKEEIYESLLDDLHRHVYIRSTVDVLERLKRQGLDRKYSDNTPRKVSIADILSPAAAQNAAALSRKKSPSSLPQIDSVTGETIEDTTLVDPEDDSRHFIAIIIECLAKLNKIPDAVEAIKVRADKELISIVKRTGRELFESTQEINSSSAAHSNFAPSDNSSLPPNLRDSLVDGVPDNTAPLLQEILDVLYTQYRCVVDVHEHVVIAKLQKIQDAASETPASMHQQHSNSSSVGPSSEQTSSGGASLQGGNTIYTVDDIGIKVQSALRLVADLYIEMCTSASEKTNPSPGSLMLVNGGSGDDGASGGAPDLNNYFIRKPKGLTAAVGGSFAKSKKCPLFRFDSSSHAMSLNAYLREQKEAMREKSEMSSDALDSIDIERILGFVRGRKND